MSEKETIDGKLRQCASLFANLGIDSTKEEREEAYAKEKALLEEIKEINLEKGNRLLIL